MQIFCIYFLSTPKNAAKNENYEERIGELIFFPLKEAANCQARCYRTQSSKKLYTQCDRHLYFWPIFTLIYFEVFNLLCETFACILIKFKISESDAKLALSTTLCCASNISMEEQYTQKFCARKILPHCLYCCPNLGKAGHYVWRSLVRAAAAAANAIAALNVTIL